MACSDKQSKEWRSSSSFIEMKFSVNSISKRIETQVPRNIGVERRREKERGRKKDGAPTKKDDFVTAPWVEII